MADIQQQHDVFSELMKEEKKKQQSFLQNQDNQSVQSLKSIGPFGKIKLLMYVNYIIILCGIKLYGIQVKHIVEAVPK